MTVANHKPYNRLVIVGNGFDLALGLNTKYNDFILDYLKQILTNYIEIDGYRSNLFKLLTPKRHSFDPGWMKNEIINAKSVKDLRNRIKDDLPIKGISAFINRLISDCENKNWVDIENLYYAYLKSTFKLSINKTRDDKIAAVKELNDQMDILTEALSAYIAGQKLNLSDRKHLERYYNLSCKMTEPLSEDYSKLLKAHSRIEPPGIVCFLTFNYTDTTNQFAIVFNWDNKVKVIPIHGTVYDPSNPIIFGYGDDVGEEYAELENYGENELFRKIKSFQYPRNKYYHALLSFLESADFDVFILGHSCGLSDRTMLKTIFEHDRCIAIQRFHYDGENEDFWKRIEISRHFSDKIKMRSRLLPYDPSASIPQADRI